MARGTFIRLQAILISFLALPAATFIQLSLSQASNSESRITTGEFDAITYNVAGLPEVISEANPVKSIRLIGEKLNDYALVFLQEDFWYHQHLVDTIRLPFKVNPDTSGALGNGLSQFSRLPILSTQNISWEDCSGVLDHASDCLTPKGFSFSRFSISDDVELHVYNVHMDAGNTEPDLTARTKQIRQLIEFLKKNSENQAIIIGGDFNFHLGKKNSADSRYFQDLLQETGLKDACYTLGCNIQKLDRFLYRGSDRVYLKALDWRLATQFKDGDGEDLSDHLPVVVRFHYQIYPSEEPVPYTRQAMRDIHLWKSLCFRL